MESSKYSRAARRMDGISTTVFAEMSALAARTGALNLGQGFPDEQGPDSIVEAAVEAMRAGRNQYPPGHGTPVLIDAVIAHQSRYYGIELDRSEVVITTGATEAVAAAILGLLDPGDELLVFEPAYDSYLAMTQMAGVVARPITLQTPDFRPDLTALAAAVTDKTKAILVNTPHNPTGTVFNAAELSAIAELAIERDLLVITDEVYEHLVFDEHRHIPISTLPGMAERTVTISSSGKTFSFTGWKIGWATGPADLVAAVEGAKNWLSYSSGAPFQPAIAHALMDRDDFITALRGQLADKRDLMCAGLAALDGVQVRVPEGTYFVTTDISELGWSSGREFCLNLPERAGVVAIPSMGFYRNVEAGRHLVRWAFCKTEAVIEEGIARLAAADLTAR